MITLTRNKKTDSKVTLKDFETVLMRKVVKPLKTQKGNQGFWKHYEFGFRHTEFAAEVRSYLRDRSTLPVDLRCVT